MHRKLKTEGFFLILVRSLICCLLVVPAKSVGPPGFDSPPFRTDKNGVAFASEIPVFGTMNITDKWNSVCIIPQNTSALVVISTCCDAALDLTPSNLTRFGNGREHVLLVPRTGKQTSVKAKSSGLCPAVTYCHGVSVASPLPLNTTVSVEVRQQYRLSVSWQPSPLMAYVLPQYDVVVSTRKSDISDGCSVIRKLRKHRATSECQTIKFDDAAATESWLVCPGFCSSSKSCSAELSLLTTVRSGEERRLYVNVFVTFYSGMRLAYGVREFCVGRADGQCAAAEETVPQRAPPDDTSVLGTRSPGPAGVLQQLVELQANISTQLATGTLRLNGVAARRGPEQQVALFVHACTNRPTTLALYKSHMLLGQRSLGRFANRYAMFVFKALPDAQLKWYVKYDIKKYTGRRGRLRVYTLIFDDAARDMLPPLASNALSVHSMLGDADRCVLNVTFALNCTHSSTVCRAKNKRYVYYRLELVHANAPVRSCARIYTTARPAGLHNITVTRVAKQRGSLLRKPQAWNYQAVLNVNRTQLLAQSYFLQLYWKEHTSNAYLPFTEAQFVVSPACTIDGMH